MSSKPISNIFCSLFTVRLMKLLQTVTLVSLSAGISLKHLYSFCKKRPQAFKGRASGLFLFLALTIFWLFYHKILSPYIIVRARCVGFPGNAIAVMVIAFLIYRNWWF